MDPQQTKHSQLKKIKTAALLKKKTLDVMCGVSAPAVR